MLEVTLGQVNFGEADFSSKTVKVRGATKNNPIVGMSFDIEKFTKKRTYYKYSATLKNGKVVEGRYWVTLPLPRE